MIPLKTMILKAFETIPYYEFSCQIIMIKERGSPLNLVRETNNLIKSNQVILLPKSL